MNVQITEQLLRCAATGYPVPALNYDIVLNGQFIGFVPMANLKPVLCMRLDAEEKAAVMRQLRIKFHPRPVAQPIEPPEPPEPKQDDSEYVDPFQAIGD